MRLAAIQLKVAPGADEMGRILEVLDEALDAGARFVFMPERPVSAMSVAQSEKFRHALAERAQRAEATIVGPNLREADDSDELEYVPVLGPEGDCAKVPVRVGKAQGRAGQATAPTTLGDLAVLSSVDCFASSELVSPGSKAPHVLLMQVSAASALEREAIRELALGRSEAQVSLVVVASLVGESGRRGGAAIMFQGEVLAEAGDDDEILAADVEPDDFVDLALLRHPVAIPELLRQKVERL